ncbi:reverse transcriptase domain-containing protein, partial [Tanacetum coccineum]
MSSKPTYNMDSNAEKMQSQGNLHPISEATLSSSELYLDELTHGVTGTIIVMICRSWDVHTITGRYVSTDFIMFDAKANKEEYHIFRDHAYMVELDGAASVRKTSVKGGGFVRYPFQLAELGNACTSVSSFLKLLLPSCFNEDEVSLSQAAVHADYSQAKEGTLENLLIWAQNRRNDVRVKIDGIKTRKGWNFPSRGGKKCKKGVVRKEGSFWCQACDRAVEYPMLRFRIELDVSDKTASTMVVLFDEPATNLVKCSADSLA